MASYYQVPETLAGKNLRDLASQYNFNPGVLSGFLGIGETQPLTSGQTVTANLPQQYVGNSSEYQALGNMFQPGMSPGQQAGQTAQSQLQSSINQGVSTLQSGIAPLKQRYNDILSSMNTAQEGAIKQAQTASSQEFGRRGISTQSGMYDQYVQGQTLPINAAYEQSKANTGLAATTAENDINSLIANLISGGGQNVANLGLNYAQLGQAQNQFEQSNALEQQKLAQALQIAQTPSQSKLSDNYATLGEGSTLYDLLNNKALYTTPKTYKGTADNSNDPLGLKP